MTSMIIDMKSILLEVDMEYIFEESARYFKALCDENRLRIVNVLRKGEKCSTHLLEELKVSQSTLSHHMKILVESEIVSSRKDGKWTYYTLSEAGCMKAKENMAYFLSKDESYTLESEDCCE